jgi:hypothetical protein
MRNPWTLSGVSSLALDVASTTFFEVGSAGSPQIGRREVHHSSRPQMPWHPQSVQRLRGPPQGKCARLTRNAL